MVFALPNAHLNPPLAATAFPLEANAHHHAAGEKLPLSRSIGMPYVHSHVFARSVGDNAMTIPSGFPNDLQLLQ